MLKFAGTVCVQTLQIGKLLHYVSSQSTVTSDEAPTARADMMASASTVTSYFDKLRTPPVIDTHFLTIYILFNVANCYFFRFLFYMSK